MLAQVLDCLVGDWGLIIDGNVRQTPSPTVCLLWLRLNTHNGRFSACGMIRVVNGWPLISVRNTCLLSPHLLVLYNALVDLPRADKSLQTVNVEYNFTIQRDQSTSGGFQVHAIFASGHVPIFTGGRSLCYSLFYVIHAVQQSQLYYNCVVRTVLYRYTVQSENRLYCTSYYSK